MSSSTKSSSSPTSNTSSGRTHYSPRTARRTRNLHTTCGRTVGRLCSELQEDYGIASAALSPEQLDEPDAEGQRILAQADILVSTAAHAAATLRVARRLNKTAMAVTLRADLMGELTRRLARGPVYIIGTDPRFRLALKTVFEPTGHGANVRPVILGEDDLADVPDDGAVFIMRRAHEQLGDTALTRRVVPIRRVFSNEMAEELLGFVIRANMAAMAARPMTA